ncbi:hypothetical protein N9934_01130 [Desulfosarcina sp.]|nr:hypothetical protein [Desulfosarcina sp.]
MEKRAEWSNITRAIIAIFVMFIVIVIVRNLLTEEQNATFDLLCGVRSDFDKDGIVDLVDTCVCKKDVGCGDPVEEAKCEEAKAAECEKLRDKG